MSRAEHGPEGATLPRVSRREGEALAALDDGDHGYEWYAFNFGAIATRSGLPRDQVRRAVRALARKGLAEYRKGLWTEDGFPAGSGYSITNTGRQVCAALALASPADRVQP